MVRGLAAIIERRGSAMNGRVRYGTNAGNAMLAWGKDVAINLDFLSGGKPMQNGFVESLTPEVR